MRSARCVVAAALFAPLLTCTFDLPQVAGTGGAAPVGSTDTSVGPGGGPSSTSSGGGCAAWLEPCAISEDCCNDPGDSDAYAAHCVEGRCWNPDDGDSCIFDGDCTYSAECCTKYCASYCNFKPNGTACETTLKAGGFDECDSRFCWNGVCACKPDGTPCGSAYECCSMKCSFDGVQGFCGADYGSCTGETGACTASSGCCSLNCVGTTCGYACKAGGAGCGTWGECCSSECLHGACK